MNLECHEVKMKKTIDELLNTPYWIIDILPKQVPANSAGQYFNVAKYYMDEKRFEQIKQKHINVILKINCYKDISIDEEKEINPSIERIEKEMKTRYLYIMIGDSMILSEADDTHMTLFNPDEELLELIKDIASKEGLFIWKGV